MFFEAVPECGRFLEKGGEGGNPTKPKFGMAGPFCGHPWALGPGDPRTFRKTNEKLNFLRA